MIEYQVHATLPDAETAREYVNWLLNGHVADVIRAGAVSGEVIRRVRPDDGHVVTARYLFKDQTSFDAYDRGPAVGLREEGRRRFPHSSGVTIQRTVGERLGLWPGDRSPVGGGA